MTGAEERLPLTAVLTGYRPKNPSIASPEPHFTIATWAIEQQSLDEAAGVLEPTFEFSQPGSVGQEPPTEAAIQAPADEVTSQSTLQLDDLGGELREIIRESGSSGWTRTSNPPVNSRPRGFDTTYY